MLPGIPFSRFAPRIFQRIRTPQPRECESILWNVFDKMQKWLIKIFMVRKEGTKRIFGNGWEAT